VIKEHDVEVELKQDQEKIFIKKKKEYEELDL
jgi:hypothetical protein